MIPQPQGPDDRGLLVEERRALQAAKLKGMWRLEVKDGKGSALVR